ncbi:mucin-2-like [Mauremys mutica]|uniref:mucin-2-like n=1 Tax=Mauremys mutica TaxID=74926 RepID=UPI001D14A632|nr:mucin-2-like [Mauremys mutica]
MDSSLHATLGLVLGCCLWGAWGQEKIHVPNGGMWGTWGEEESCPGNSFAVGFSLKVQWPRHARDNTALNGIRLLCSNGRTIQSNVGPWGWWGRVKKCPSGQRLTQFRLRVEPCRGLKDDTAANNIEFVCTGGAELRGHGGRRGKWGPQSRSCRRRGICTIATKVQAPQGKGDDTALNDVYFRCCRPETLPTTTTLPPITSAQPPITSAQPPITSAQPPITSAQAPITSAQPPITSAQPPITSAQPPITSAQPPITSAQPPITSAQPPITSAQAPITSAQPPITSAQPPITSIQPPITSAQPPITSIQPPITSTQPLSTSTQPPITSTQPPITSAEPPITSAEPPITSAQPPITSIQPPITSAPLLPLPTRPEPGSQLLPRRPPCV